ncbi:MAG: dockerin type I repeat-containing protein [Phycisphaerae bacterium]
MDPTTCGNLGGVYLGDHTVCSAPEFVAPSSCGSFLLDVGTNGAPDGGEVNISGATLFKDFFTRPASTNADCLAPLGGGPVNGKMWPNDPPACVTLVPFCRFFTNVCPGFGATNQLAPNWNCISGTPFYWIVQYRGSGSLEGITEFVDNQLLDIIPTFKPADSGYINRSQWANAAGKLPIGGCSEADAQGDGVTTNDSGTPLIPHAIDVAVSDVPSTEAVVGPGSGADARWNRKPTQAGYGLNPRSSTAGLPSTLVSLVRSPFALNQNNNPPTTPAPDGSTIYDSTIAWVPIAAITNRGTGIRDIRYTDLQFLAVTGRMSTGENLQSGTRDVGSGTRNGFQNSLGVDPSQGNGDNLGPRINFSQESNVGIVPAGGPFDLPAGSRTQPTNCGGSGIMENAVKQRRLAVGHTGLFGGRAASLQRSGVLEIMNVAKDVDDDGKRIPGFVPTPQVGDPPGGGCPTPPANRRPANNGYVRPAVDTCLDNSNGLLGYQIGGPETFITRGDPKAGIGGNTNPAMGNISARDYIRNIVYSVENFVAAPAQDVNNNMPGQYLAFSFTLTQGVDALPDLRNPTKFIAQPVNQTLQDWMRCNNSDSPNAFGAANVAGLVPLRNTRVGFGGAYSDGSTNGAYLAFNGVSYTVTDGLRLNRRNLISGDFNNDGLRNLNDAAKLMEALKDPRAFTTAEGISPGTGGGQGVCADDFVVPEIIGDFDGDGDFNALDARYFADGLAIDPATGQLDRKQGFIAVDNAWAGLGMGSNYFGTTLATGATYKPGDSRADVAGSPAGAFRGAYPNGQNGSVNAADIDYVYRNFGSWKNIDQAAGIDLSCDMTGDLLVDQRDVDEVVFAILCTRYGDVDLDGDVDAADRAVVVANQGQLNLGWAGGDLNGDGVVNALDLALVDANLGFVGPACIGTLCGDINGDGVVNNADIAPFLAGIEGRMNDPATLGRSDLDSIPPANGADVQRFVCCLLNAGDPALCP